MSFVSSRPRARHRRPTPLGKAGKAALVTTAAGALAAGITPATASAATTGTTASQADTTAARSAALRPTLRYGSHGPAVRWVQKRLGVTANSHFGAVTRNAVLRFQRAKAIPRTGVVDSRTWDAFGVRRPRQAASARGTRVVNIAASLKGTPYRYGGTTPRGFDCSGYSSYVYRQVGVALPRTSQAQYARATRISRAAARPGDLVFFLSGSHVYHLGIYAGGNQIWHSPRAGKTVSKVAIWSRSVSFGRV